MLDDLIDLLGRKAALELVMALGGAVITVPNWRETPVPGSWLARIVKAIGPVAARKLCDSYQLEQISIPRGRPIRASEIAAKVRELRTSGYYVNDIALATGVTARRVLQILAEVRREAESNQANLFTGGA